MTKSSVLGALFAAGAMACSAESQISAPRVPVPVLIGPVDRVGGHRGEGEGITSVRVEVEDFLAVSTSREVIGNMVYETRTTERMHEGSGKLSHRILEATGAKHDKDVRIRTIGTGAWAGSGKRDEWVEVEATVAKEQGR
jgi:hypothetical protein